MGHVIPAYRSTALPVRGQRVAGPARAVANPAYAAKLGVSGRRLPTEAAMRRRRVQKRRRDVFFALVAGAVGFFLLALIPGLSVLWSAQVLFDVLLAGYVALLVHIRNVAAERELKLTFLSQQPARVARPRPSYDFGGGGYGELDLRRAVN
jgi:hypothetical protein